MPALHGADTLLPASTLHALDAFGQMDLATEDEDTNTQGFNEDGEGEVFFFNNNGDVGDDNNTRIDDDPDPADRVLKKKEVGKKSAGRPRTRTHTFKNSNRGVSILPLGDNCC